MPLSGGDGPRLTLAAAALVASIGQGANDPAVMLTVPLQRTDLRPSSTPAMSVSADGRFVAFVSSARLVPADTDNRPDIYVLDRDSGAITLETAGAAALSEDTPAISGTGRLVVYEAGADGDTNVGVLVLRDRASGVVRILQRGGTMPNGSSRSPSITADGRFVAFTSSATNLVEAADVNDAIEEIWRVDVASMSFRRVSAESAGASSARRSSFGPSISDDGRFVAFTSAAARFPASAKGTDVYVRDLQQGTLTKVSVAYDGGAADGSSHSAAISGDGRHVAFVSEATNLVRRRDRNRVTDVYVRDMAADVTELVSRTPSGEPGNGPSGHPALSADGAIVVFQSDASDLVCGDRCAVADRDINLVADIFRRDRAAGLTERVSRGRTLWMEPSVGPATDRSGTIIAFASRHPLDQSDDGHDYDLFVWARDRRR